MGNNLKLFLLDFTMKAESDKLTNVSRLTESFETIGLIANEEYPAFSFPVNCNTLKADSIEVCPTVIDCVFPFNSSNDKKIISESLILFEKYIQLCKKNNFIL
jgi:hypothetical protein